ncbi:MAG: beta-1,6-N-acetylglucosaminyltransferase [Verrucomicrobiota bacterium]
MRISFLIAAHSHPELLARLVKRLEDPDASIFVHIDKAVDLRPFKAAMLDQGVGNFFWVPRVRSGWARFGQVKASLSLLRTALAQDHTSERFILLSGQDYPLLSPARIAAFFESKPGVNFIECFPLPWERWSDSGGLGRLQRFHFALGSRRFKYPSEQLPNSRLIRAVYPICRLFLPETRKLPENFTFYGGANWWSLTRDAASASLEFVRRHPDFSKSFYFSKSSDEIFFQTALMHTGPWEMDSDHLRCVFWDGRRNEHPALMRLEDFDEIQRSGKLFVRKVDPLQSAALLDRIDHDLLMVKPAT